MIYEILYKRKKKPTEVWYCNEMTEVIDIMNFLKKHNYFEVLVRIYRSRKIIHDSRADGRMLLDRYCATAEENSRRSLDLIPN